MHASDGDIGHIEGFVVDDESWAIRYLIVNTSDWWLGHQVLIARPWVANISWIEATVSIELTREAIKSAPRSTARRCPIVPRSACCTNITDARATGMAIDASADQYSRALEATGTQVSEGEIGMLQRIGVDPGDDAHLRRQAEKIQAVLPCQIGDGQQLSLLP